MNLPILINKNIYLIYWYLVAKIISLILIIIFLPIIFEKNYFYSNDFYNLYILCDFRSPNFLFSIITCFLKIKNLTDIQALFLSASLSFLKDVLFIIVASKFLKKNYLISYCLFLAMHPYLNLYYLKFTPDLINNLMISLYFFLIMKNKAFKTSLNLVFLFGSMMRNSLVPFFISHYLIKIFKKKFIERKRLSQNKVTIRQDLIYIIAFSLILLVDNSDYGTRFLSANQKYDLNLTFFIDKINTGLIYLDYLIAIPLNLITHCILLMGFREQAYTEFLEFFSYNNEFLYFYLIFGLILFFFHLIGFLYFFKNFIKSNIYILTFLVFILPHIFLVTHLRYFMPLMPISIFGVCLLMQNFLKQNKKK